MKAIRAEERIHFVSQNCLRDGGCPFLQGLDIVDDNRKRINTCANCRCVQDIPKVHIIDALTEILKRSGMAVNEQGYIVKTGEAEKPIISETGDAKPGRTVLPRGTGKKLKLPVPVIVKVLQVYEATHSYRAVEEQTGVGRETVKNIITRGFNDNTLVDEALQAIKEQKT